MAELCRNCFIEIWKPSDNDIDNIVMSEDNDMCEGCMIWDKYVEHIKGNEETEMEKAMLSQPMAGKTDDEIRNTRDEAIKVLEKMGYTIVNTLFLDEWYSDKKMIERGVVQIPLCFLAKSLENMSLCHAAYFCKGWENARGCRIEHEAAREYGLKIIYEVE